MRPDCQQERVLSPRDEDLLRAELPPVTEVDLPASTQFPDGGKISYRSAGPRDGNAVVCLHGLGSSSAGYRGQLEGLSPRMRVVAWDAPGFARSASMQSAAPVVDDYADALEAFVQALELPVPLTLVGSSWGSVIATAYASRYPDRVGALVLMAPNVARGRLPERELLLQRALADAGKVLAEDRSEVAKRLLPADAPQLVREIVMRLRDATTLKGWMQAIGMLFSVHTPERLATVRCPVTIVVGEEDKLAPPASHAIPLRDCAQQATLHELPRCGHMPKLEYPSLVNDLILDASRP